MKFLMLMLFALPALATTSLNPYVYFVDTSGTSTHLLSTFLKAPQIGTLSSLGTSAAVQGPPQKIASVDISNGATSPIVVNCSSTSQPAIVSGQNSLTEQYSIVVPGSTSYSSPINGLIPYPFVNVCWVRSLSGTLSTGQVEVVAWGF